MGFTTGKGRGGPAPARSKPSFVSGSFFLSVHFYILLRPDSCRSVFQFFNTLHPPSSLQHGKRRWQLSLCFPFFLSVPTRGGLESRGCSARCVRLSCFSGSLRPCSPPPSSVTRMGADERKMPSELTDGNPRPARPLGGGSAEQRDGFGVGAGACLGPWEALTKCRRLGGRQPQTIIPSRFWSLEAQARCWRNRLPPRLGRSLPSEGPAHPLACGGLCRPVVMKYEGIVTPGAESGHFFCIACCEELEASALRAGSGKSGFRCFPPVAAHSRRHVLNLYNSGKRISAER